MIGASQLLARFSFLLYFFIYRYALENHAKALASFPQRTIRTILKKILAGAWVITGCKHPTQAKSCKTISCFSHCKRRYTSVLAMSAFESVVSFQAAAPLHTAHIPARIRLAALLLRQNRSTIVLRFFVLPGSACQRLLRWSTIDFGAFRSAILFCARI